MKCRERARTANMSRNIPTAVAHGAEGQRLVEGRTPNAEKSLIIIIMIIIIIIIGHTIN
jgi:hypothetical protein